MADLGTLLVRIKGDSAQFNRVMADSERKFAETSKKLQDIGGKLTKFVTLPIVGIGAAALKSAADMEKQEVAFATMLKSADKARSLLHDIEQFSKRTPFQFPQLVQAAKRLYGVGEAQETIVETMRQLGDLAMGQPEQLDRIVNAYAKMQSKGRATLEELNLFLEAGVDILPALEEQLDLTREGLTKFISTGALTFEDVRSAIENLTTGTGKYAGITEAAAGTLSGLFSTLKDNFAALGRDLVNVLLPTIKDITANLIAMIQRWQEMDEGTKRLILGFAGVAAAVGPVLLVVGKLGTAFVALQSTAAVLGPLLAGPFAPIAVVVGAATAAVGILIKRYRDIKKEAEDLAKIEAYNNDVQARSRDLGKQLYAQAKQSVVIAASEEELLAAKAELEEKINRLYDEQSSVLDIIAGKRSTGEKQIQDEIQLKGQLAAIELALADIQKGETVPTLSRLDQLAIDMSERWRELNEQINISAEIHGKLGEEFDIVAAKQSALGELIQDYYEKGLTVGSTLESLINLYKSYSEQLDENAEKQRIQTEIEAEIETERRESHAALLERIRETREEEAAELKEKLERYEKDKAEREKLVARFEELHIDEIAKIEEEKQAFIDAGISKIEAEEWAQEQIRAARHQTFQESISQAEGYLSSVTDLALQELDVKADILKQENANNELTEKQKADLARRQAIVQRVGSVLEVVANTAIAISKSIEASPLTGGLPFSAINAALGAAQVALILARPLPPRLQYGGRVLPTVGGTSVIMGEAGVPEVAVPETPLAFRQLSTGIAGELERIATRPINNTFSPIDERPIIINIEGNKLDSYITDKIRRRAILVSQGSIVR